MKMMRNNSEEFRHFLIKNNSLFSTIASSCNQKHDEDVYTQNNLPSSQKKISDKGTKKIILHIINFYSIKHKCSWEFIKMA